MKLIHTIALTAAGVILFDASALTAFNRYVNPISGEIVPAESVYAAPGTVLTVDDLCHYENVPRIYITSVTAREGAGTLPEIADGWSALYLGDACGVYDVTVADCPDEILPENTVTVYVGTPA
ncbi:MAG: hypothetical protein K5705_02160 [Oscillospiraceae bacterium]|nr:hypothetical protein [Oscillospiraceae bacterium]MCR4759074.1 hypothetical protein [Oscillospiraceae bacterium]